MTNQSEKHEIVDLLESAWELRPHRRFLQLICDVLGEFEPDVYYIEDSELRDALKKFLGRD